MKYSRIEPKMLEGSEQITDENGNQVSDVLGYWCWAYSTIIDNTDRGVFAEFLVACALGIEDKARINWDKYDLVSPEGISVEVKASGYIQTWEQKELSSLQFSIRPTYGWDSKTNTYSEERIRQADIYVFCVHKHKDQDTVNPLDLTQWEFYLIPTKLLNEKAGKQKRASLSSLIKMGAQKCEFSRIHERIIQLCINDGEVNK